MYGKNKKDLAEIIKKLCSMKTLKLIEGKLCAGHIHIYEAILLEFSISEYILYLKEKIVLMFFGRYLELRLRYKDKHFGIRGYYVGIEENVNKDTII